jgi:hypothetical protein
MTPGLRFSYLLAHPEALGVSFPHPAALLLLLCIPLLIALVRRDLSRHWLALGCRLAAFVLLVLTLAGLAVSARMPSDRLSLIAAVDVSESIGTWTTSPPRLHPAMSWAWLRSPRKVRSSPHPRRRVR